MEKNRQLNSLGSSNDQKVNEIAGKLLGKKGGEGYSSTYDPSLLVRIPRSLNREQYGIEEKNLPFAGYDVWNGYEVTAMTEFGYPVAAVMKIVIPANSEYHPESKSIKMYFNSFAMEQKGRSRKECLDWIKETAKKDLEELLECEVKIGVFTDSYQYEKLAKSTFDDPGFFNMEECFDQNEIVVSDYKMNPDLLVEEPFGYQDDILRFKTDVLRSACRVTHQPDHGSVLIYMNGKHLPTMESLYKFIISFRNEYHFHEEICEAIYKTLLDKYNPTSLMVACNYTRRGGWDINPVRANRMDLVPVEYETEKIPLKKTIKQ